MMRNISIFDTTLRDGEQAPGNQMSVAHKLALFKVLDDAGVDFIEIGFPAASKLDFIATKLLAKISRKACVSVFARANKADVDVAASAVEDKTNVQLQLLTASSEIHLIKKMQITAEQTIQNLITAINYAQSCGFHRISVGLEDAFRGSQELRFRFAQASIDNGADTIVVADTVGAATPCEFFQLIADLRAFVGEKIQISVHCHNDLGLGVANSLEAIRAGADCVQTTLCGIGERAGNAAMEEILTALHYKSDVYGAKTSVDPQKIYNVCYILADILKLSINPHKPILGHNVFSTTAGIHIKGILSDPETYEFVEPHLFGQDRSFVVSRLSGRGLIAHTFETLGLPVATDLLESMYMQISNEINLSKYNNTNDLINLYCDLLLKEQF